MHVNYRKVSQFRRTFTRALRFINTITELLLNCPLTYETICVIIENENELLIRNNHRLQ